MTDPASSPPSGAHQPWLLVAGLFSLVVALVAAMLKASTGVVPAEAALSGGAAFATSMGLWVTILIARRLL